MNASHSLWATGRDPGEVMPAAAYYRSTSGIWEIRFNQTAD